MSFGGIITNKNLQTYRKVIDNIDNQIMTLLDQRFNIVKKIGYYKKNNNIIIENKERENEILNNINIKYKININSIFAIYKKIFEESKKIEKQFI